MDSIHMMTQQVFFFVFPASRTFDLYTICSLLIFFNFFRFYYYCAISFCNLAVVSFNLRSFAFLKFSIYF